MVCTDKLSTVEDQKSVGKLWAIRPLLECENPDSLVFSRRVGGYFCVPAEGFEPYSRLWILVGFSRLVSVSGDFGSSRARSSAYSFVKVWANCGHGITPPSCEHH